MTSDDGLFQIRIPVEGLQPDVVPALETQTDPATGEKVYALTPVGEISLLPMTATLPAVNAQGQQNIALFPVEGTGALIPLKTVVVGDRLQAKTVHFSRFGTSGSIPISDEETAKETFLRSYGGLIKDLENGDRFAPPDATPGFVAAYGPYPLAQGDSFGSGIPEVDLQRDDQDLSVSATLEPDSAFTTVDQDGWFFLVDLLDGSLFGHPVLYVFLDKSGRFCEVLALQPPSLNDIPILISQDQREASPKRIVGSSPSQVRSSDAPLARDEGDFELTNCKRIAIVLSFSPESFVVATEKRLTDKLQSINLPCVSRRIETFAEVKALVDQIKTFQETTCECEGFDEVFLYVIGHGVPPDAFSGLSKLTALGNFDLGDNVLTDPAAIAVYGSDGTQIEDGGSPRQIDLLNILLEVDRLCRKRTDPSDASTETGKLKVFIESCFSAGLLQELDALRRRIDGNTGTNEKFNKIACLKAEIITAARRNQIALGRVVNLSREKNQLATEAFVNNLVVDANNLIDMRATYNAGLNKRFRIVLAQDPQFKSYGGVEEFGRSPTGCPCCVKEDLPQPPPDFSASIDTDIGQDGDQLFADFSHTVGETSCPQPLPPIFVKNTGSQDIVVKVSAVGAHLVVSSPGPFTVSPGNTRVVNVAFDCSTTSPFESIVTVMTSGSGTGLTVDVTYSGNVSFP